MMLHLLTNIPFVLYYLVIAENQDLRVWFTNIIGIIFFSFSLLTGIGFWVKDPGHSGLWQSCPETPTLSFAYSATTGVGALGHEKFIKALKQEARESNTLIQAMGKPAVKK